MQLSRRKFGVVAAGLFGSGVQAQTSEWGGPVVDIHFHFRQRPEANVAHLDGAGLSNAVFLARENTAEQVRAVRSQYPGRFLGWMASTDLTRPDAVKVLTDAAKAGAVGFGELKSHVAADGPELRRVFAAAAEFQVPVLFHIQEDAHSAKEGGGFSTGWKQFGAVLKANPKTRFIGHANSFWANVSAESHDETAYPTGAIARGGVTDQWLSDHENLFGDLSANSGNNALTRDPSFTPDFLKRHQSKLLFGSDCPCTDGKGGGSTGRLAGKCVARETLSILKASASPAIFRKIAWENAHKMLRLPA